MESRSRASSGSQEEAERQDGYDDDDTLLISFTRNRRLQHVSRSCENNLITLFLISGPYARIAASLLS